MSATGDDASVARREIVGVRLTGRSVGGVWLDEEPGLGRPVEVDAIAREVPEQGADRR